MKTIKLKNRIVKIKTKRLINLLSENNKIDNNKLDCLTNLYQATTLIGKPIKGIVIDLEIQLITDKGFNIGKIKTYSLDDNTNNPFGSIGFKYGKLCDVIGVSNKTSYWME